MARLSGIPSRVAVGFTRGTKQKDGSWLVTTHDAHAWPELYFQGYGWLAFEPTPRADGQADRSVVRACTDRVAPRPATTRAADQDRQRRRRRTAHGFRPRHTAPDKAVQRASSPAQRPPARIRRRSGLTARCGDRPRAAAGGARHARVVTRRRRWRRVPRAGHRGRRSLGGAAGLRDRPGVPWDDGHTPRQIARHPPWSALRADSRRPGRDQAAALMRGALALCPHAHDAGHRPAPRRRWSFAPRRPRGVRVAAAGCPADAALDHAIDHGRGRADRRWLRPSDRRSARAAAHHRRPDCGRERPFGAVRASSTAAVPAPAPARAALAVVLAALPAVLEPLDAPNAWAHGRSRDVRSPAPVVVATRCPVIRCHDATPNDTAASMTMNPATPSGISGMTTPASSRRCR